jgi:hypothetical protein
MPALAVVMTDHGTETLLILSRRYALPAHSIEGLCYCAWDRQECLSYFGRRGMEIVFY